MSTAAELAWLIPVLPLLGAVITGLGLISFNRTINRLRKPVALLLISCVGAAAVLSYAVLADQLAGAAPVEHLFIWASAGSFSLPMGYVVDSLGAVISRSASYSCANIKSWTWFIRGFCKVFT